MKKVVLVSLAAVFASSAHAEGSNIIDELMTAVDTSTLLATLTSLGLVAVAVKFGDKGIVFVKRLIGRL